MTTLPARTHSALYLAIAERLSQSDPDLAKRMTVADLAGLLADSQAVMDASQPGQVASVEDMIEIVAKGYSK